MPKPKSPAKPTEADKTNPGESAELKKVRAQKESAQAGSTKAKGKAGGSGKDSKGGEDSDEEEVKQPTIKAKWAKRRVTPDHNSSWPPATPPTDVVPDEAKAEMVVDTTDVPDGTTASITVCQCFFEIPVQGGSISGLVVQGDKVVDPATGKRPFFVFTHANSIYAPWDMDLYYFQVTVDYQGLSEETEKNAKKKEKKCLRVMWYHMNVADAVADTPAGGGLSTQAEMREIKKIMDSKRHHKSGSQAFNQANVPVNLWGSVLRNTYSYHHASHGDIVDRTTGAQLNAGNANPPPGPVGNWRSVIVLGNTNLGDVEVSQQANVPSTPKYLAYLDTCVAGWEPSFVQAIISRGTRNVIAFRMYIPDGAARSMARKFHKKWIKTHKGDPDKINPVFFAVGARFYNSMRPVLFGHAGGDIVPGGRKPNKLMGEINELLGFNH